VSCN